MKFGKGVPTGVVIGILYGTYIGLALIFKFDFFKTENPSDFFSHIKLVSMLFVLIILLNIFLYKGNAEQLFTIPVTIASEVFIFTIIVGVINRIVLNSSLISLIIGSVIVILNTLYSVKRVKNSR